MDKPQAAEPASTGGGRGGATDLLKFLRSAVTAPVLTGAQWPSGKALCRAMAGAVDLSVPGPIVELGPGTGVVTQALLARGISPSRLTLIEFSPQFSKHLAARFPDVRLIQGDAYAIADHVRRLGLGPLAAVVSSLPLLTRPPQRRVELLRSALDLMHPRGVFVQFTYARVSPIPVAGLDVVTTVTPRIWMNIWPALVYSYRRRDAEQPPADDIAAE